MGHATWKQWVVTVIGIIVAAGLSALVATCLASCSDAGPAVDDAGVDGGDADADGDGDTDVDGDTDADASPDASPDAGDASPGACPLNSGWPCPCEVGTTCGDWSECRVEPGLDQDHGVCAPQADPCPAWNDLPGLADPLGYCLLQCQPEDVCPEGETCQQVPGGLKVCYPVPE